MQVARVAGIALYVHPTWVIGFVLVTWALGAEVATALTASVLIHELTHALVARARGLDIDDITLFFFGGITNLSRHPRAARDELLIASAGPLASLLIGGLCLAAAQLAQTAALDSVIAVNLVLGVFNLVPCYPLDGGRALRAIFWAATRDRRRATRLAATIGQALGCLIIALGVSRILGRDVLNGAWTVMLGLILAASATSSRSRRARTLLKRFNPFGA